MIWSKKRHLSGKVFKDLKDFKDFNDLNVREKLNQ